MINIDGEINQTVASIKVLFDIIFYLLIFLSSRLFSSPTLVAY